jgi:hypothetical protein
LAIEQDISGIKIGFGNDIWKLLVVLQIVKTSSKCKPQGRESNGRIWGYKLFLEETSSVEKKLKYDTFPHLDTWRLLNLYELDAKLICYSVC